jgi:hypothetical protein
MKGIEIKDAYPKAWEAIREQLFEDLKKTTEGVPDDFAKAVIEMGIPDYKIDYAIEQNPRLLFDVFDVFNLFIHITHSVNGFSTKVLLWFSNISEEILSKTRKEADYNGVELAFKTLEIQLNSITPDNSLPTSNPEI